MKSSILANQVIAKKLKGDERMYQALLELMKPEISLIIEKAVKESTDRVAKETADRVAKEVADGEAKTIAIILLKSGKFSPEEIQQYIPRLSVEEIKALAA